MDNNMQSLFDGAIEKGGALIVNYAFSVLGAIAILIIGFWLSRILSRWAEKNLSRLKGIDSTLAAFFGNIVRYAIIILVVVTVLAQFGVQTTSIVAALGAAGLAIGLALQGTLANIASGIMLLVLRPFQVGDYIDAQTVSGTVNAIGLFTTEMTQANGLFVMVPNSQLWNRPIINFSRHKTRRLEIITGIGYGDSIADAKAILANICAQDARILASPAPQIYVNSLDESSVGIGLRVWTNTSDYIATERDAIEAIKHDFDENGITIPFPQREVRQI